MIKLSLTLLGGAGRPPLRVEIHLEFRDENKSALGGKRERANRDDSKARPSYSDSYFVTPFYIGIK